MGAKLALKRTPMVKGGTMATAPMLSTIASNMSMHMLDLRADPPSAQEVLALHSDSVNMLL